MGADYVWSTKKGEDVFHVFLLCHDALNIKKKHRTVGASAPPGRRLCEACEAEMRSLLS